MGTGNSGAGGSPVPRPIPFPGETRGLDQRTAGVSGPERPGSSRLTTERQLLVFSWVLVKSTEECTPLFYNNEKSDTSISKGEVKNDTRPLSRGEVKAAYMHRMRKSPERKVCIM